MPGEELVRHRKRSWKKGQQETGLARRSQGSQEGFSWYMGKNQWKTVLSKLLLQNDIPGRILNLKLSNRLWMASSTTQEWTPKPLISFGIRPALSALPVVAGPFPGLVTFALLPKALSHKVLVMQWDASFSVEVNFCSYRGRGTINNVAVDVLRTLKLEVR